MSMSSAPTLSAFVNQQLSGFQKSMIVFLSVVLSLAAAATSLKLEIGSIDNTLASTSPYVASLVEGQDRPELQRFVSTLSRSTERAIFISHGNKIIASSNGPEELDQPDMVTSNRGISIQNGKVWISRELVSDRGNALTQGYLRCAVNLRAILLTALATAIFVAVMGGLAAKLISRQIKRTINRALAPLVSLQSEIQAMNSDSDPLATPSKDSFQELENIRHTVRETHLELRDTQERLGKAKGKELASDAYRRLIHDLHNPIQAMRNLSLIAQDHELDRGTRDEANQEIPALASQLLNQIDNAKENLNFDSPKIEKTDLRPLVNHIVREYSMASERVKIETRFLNDAVLMETDPIFMGRVLRNLISNAIDAAQSSVVLTLNHTGEKCILSVEDDGSGIPSEKVGLYLQGRLPSTKRDRTAIGLSSVNHLVRLLGGKVVYRPSTLGGASFEVLL